MWQVQDGFGFRLANAYVGSFPPALPDAVRRFEFGQPVAAGQEDAVRRWLREQGVSAVLVVEPTATAVERVRRLLGSAPRPLGGAVLLPVPR